MPYLSKIVFELITIIEMDIMYDSYVEFNCNIITIYYILITLEDLSIVRVQSTKKYIKQILMHAGVDHFQMD